MAGELQVAEKLDVRELRPSDIDSFAELCETRPHQTRASAARRARAVEWMAFHNPEADGRPGYFVAVRGDRVLGHLGRMPTTFQIEKQRVKGSYIHDLYVHPELRASSGQGFFASMRLYRACEKAADGICVLVWTNEINIELQRARKYEEMWAGHYVKILGLDEKIDRVVESERGAQLSKTIVRAGLRALDHAIAVTAPKPHEVVRIDRCDERFDRLADRLAGRIGISPVKTHRYLNWKYADYPHLDHAMFATIDHDGEVCGFVVAVRGESATSGMVADMSCDPEDKATLVSLFKAAHSHLRSLGVTRVECAASDPRVLAVMRKWLYMERPPRHPLFLAQLNRFPRPALLRDVDRWNLMYGDSEGPL